MNLLTPFVLAAAAVAAAFSQTIRTDAEPRTVRLEDGTQITMNVNSELVVAYGRQMRRVTLKSGEAIFNVAKQSGWPFVVIAGKQQVTALGSSFDVRANRNEISVVLIEGTLTVKPVARSAAEIRSPRRDTIHTLTPGQRVVLAGTDRILLRDRPLLDDLLSWQRGKLNMHDLPLAEAIAEMNRYSSARLELEGPPRAAAFPVSGIFTAGDSLSFAQAVAVQQGWQVRQRGNRIVLVAAQ